MENNKTQKKEDKIKKNINKKNWSHRIIVITALIQADWFSETISLNEVQLRNMMWKWSNERIIKPKVQNLWNDSNKILLSQHISDIHIFFI